MIAIYYRLFAAAIIFIIAFFFGLLPILLHRKSSKNHLLTYGESFARGIFLGAGFIHLLPDAINHFQRVMGNVDYPIIPTLCALAILFLYFIEQGIASLFDKNVSHQKTWKAYLLLIILSIHSILAGVALGVDTTLASFIIIFVAIIAHKGSAAFALSISMNVNEIKTRRIINLIFVFSLMTPIGILFGSYVHHILQNNNAILISSIFNALAAGTFIYIALFDRVDKNKCPSHRIHELVKAFYFILGTSIMAVVAIWL